MTQPTCATCLELAQLIRYAMDKFVEEHAPRDLPAEAVAKAEDARALKTKWWRLGAEAMWGAILAKTGLWVTDKPSIPDPTDAIMREGEG